MQLLLLLSHRNVPLRVSGQVVPRSTRKRSTRTHPSQLVPETFERQVNSYPGM